MGGPIVKQSRNFLQSTHITIKRVECYLDIMIFVLSQNFVLASCHLYQRIRDLSSGNLPSCSFADQLFDSMRMIVSFYQYVTIERFLLKKKSLVKAYCEENTNWCYAYYMVNTKTYNVDNANKNNLNYVIVAHWKNLIWVQ